MDDKEGAVGTEELGQGFFALPFHGRRKNARGLNGDDDRRVLIKNGGRGSNIGWGGGSARGSPKRMK
jgi:hypothetical protein